MEQVARHYGNAGLFQDVLQWLRERGIQHPTRADISIIDEFHVRGAEVSLELAAEAGFAAQTSILDVGCGIGGPARMLADTYGSHVTGIDLTADFVDTATKLSELVGLQDKTTFICADALNMPFEDSRFDVAWTQHVQMNVENKSAFYSEIARVVKHGGRFIYYDIFSRNGEALKFPVPWADNASISFLMTTQSLDDILTNLGFRRVLVHDQTEAGRNFLQHMMQKMANSNTRPPLAVLVRDQPKVRFENLLHNIMEGKLELQSGIYLKEEK